MRETKIGNKSEVKMVKWTNFKNDYDGRKGQRSKKGQGEGKIIRDDKKLTTAIIQSSIQGCPAEYRGEQKTTWQLNKLKQEAEKKGILEEGFFILKETADCFIADRKSVV